MKYAGAKRMVENAGGGAISGSRVIAVLLDGRL